jgi:ketosteroid isomerase-like protein
VSEASELLRLNLEITEQERRGAEATPFFEHMLDDRLCFRRGDGSTIGKKEFLAGLADPGNTNEVLTASIRQAQILDDQAFVEAWVYLKGNRGGRLIDGTFRNLRFFERPSNGTWRCVMWFNKPLPSHPPTHS